MARTTAPKPGSVRITPNKTGYVHFEGAGAFVSASADVVDRLRVEYIQTRHWFMNYWSYNGNDYYNEITPLPRIILKGPKGRVQQIWYIPMIGMEELWIHDIYEHSVPWRTLSHLKDSFIY